MTNVTLNVVRGDIESGRRTEEFLVPYREGMSLLDAIFWVREHEDTSIVVRYSCRSANACKECMAVVNGKPGYLCSIRAVPDSNVTIEPMSGRPWIRDLTTSME